MTTEQSAPRWLLLIHQLPSRPSKLRVKVWRRLQGVGAVLIKKAVYVLPNSNEGREDFEWIRGEIVAQGGEATVFTANAVDDATTQEIIDAFLAARRSDWNALRRGAEALSRGRESAIGNHETSRAKFERELKGLRSRAAQIDKIDYFRAPGRQEAMAALGGAGATSRPETAESAPAGLPRPAAGFRGRRWLTRPRPGVDRMASAWLIRRFIDPQAEFLFAERIAPGLDLIPFDMFGVEFGHQGNRCTFETLLRAFGLDEPSLTRIGKIVHDLDLRSLSPGDIETSTLGRLIDGLREACEEDPSLLEHGMELFEALYRSFRGEPTVG